MEVNMQIVPYEHKVQYYETDKMGIVHHSNYIRWFEEARVDYLEQVGHPYESVEKAGVICPVLSVECKYRTMTHFGDRVLVKLWVEKFNGVRLVIGYEISDKETGEVRCTGSSSHCYLNEEGKLVNLKKVDEKLYQIYLEDLNTHSR